MDARDIKPLVREETEKIAHGELQAFVGLLDQLDAPDWERPTACDLWNVRDVVAHQGGHVQAGTGLRGMVAQFSPKLVKPYRKQGMNMLDAMNQAQVDMRRGWSHETLIAEMRDRTPEAIAARRRLPFASRLIRVPAADYGFIPVDYLLHTVFPRDMWIHRLDIADATGRPFVMTPDHDGVLAAHVVRDMDRNVKKRLPGHSIQLTVDGPAGGAWRLGTGDQIAVRMDILDFMRVSSGRMKPERALLVTEVSTTDPSLKARVIRSLAAVY